MKDIEKIKENLYIQKTPFGYKIVNPIRKDIDKPLTKDNIHWKRLLIGDWSRFISTLVFILLILLVSWSYSHDTAECRDVIENLGEYCEEYNPTPYPQDPYQITFPESVKRSLEV
jgi:hypothetical protein